MQLFPTANSDLCCRDAFNVAGINESHDRFHVHGISDLRRIMPNACGGNHQILVKTTENRFVRVARIEPTQITSC